MARKKVAQAIEKEAARAECAFMNCDRPAMVRVRVTPTGWSNFCERHYDEWHLRRAQETCVRLNLKTIEEKRAWIRKHSHVIKRFPDARTQEDT